MFKGIIGALGTRAQRVCSKENAPKERRHLREVLRRNGYQEKEVSRGLQASKSDTPATGRRYSLPYFPGTSERIAKILREVGVLACMRPISTIQSMLVRKRPEEPRIHGAVYDIPCADCSWHYVGETGRTVKERQKEHLRSVRDFDVLRSEVARHAIEDDHRVKVEDMKILEKEPNWRRRIVKEALWTSKLGGSNKVKHEIGTAWRF